MKRVSAIAAAACLISIIAGCAPIEELEQENTLLRRRVDSLDVLRESCNARLATLTQRITTIEQEKLILEANARQAAQQLSASGALPVAVVEPATSPPSAVAEPRPATRAGGASSSGTAPSIVSAPAAVPSTASVQPPVEQRSEDGQDEQAGRLKESTAPETIPTQAELTRIERPLAATPPPTVASENPASDRYLSRYQEALSLFNRRNYAKALPMFEALADTDPPNDMNDNAWYWMGECLHALGRHQEAVNAFSTVIGMRGSDKKEAALMMRANTYRKLGRNAAAKQDYQRVVELFPNGEYRSRAQKQLRGMR